MSSDIIKLGSEGINQIWRDVKLRAVGIKRAKTLVEAAQKSIGCKEGLEAARMDMELLIMDYEYKRAQYEQRRSIKCTHFLIKSMKYVLYLYKNSFYQKMKNCDTARIKEISQDYMRRRYRTKIKFKYSNNDSGIFFKYML